MTMLQVSSKALHVKNESSKNRDNLLCCLVLKVIVPQVL